MRTVILGGAGFVGLAVARTLVGRGDEVVLADRTAPPAPALATLGHSVRFIAADVLDPASVARAIPSGTDRVVCGAAITADATRDASEPLRILDTNLLGFVRALEAARAAGVRRVLNLSSAGAYGDAAFREEPLLEDGPTTPRSLYALSKLGTEIAGERLAGLWGMELVSVRLSAVFGPFERLTGVRDTPSALFQIMRTARAGTPIVMPAPGLRDWVYATDVAEAVATLLETPELRHRLYNIGPGVRFAALAWGAALAARRPGLVCRLAEPGETASVQFSPPADRAPLSIARITADTTWRPRFGLTESLEDYLAWCDAHPDLAPGA